MVLRRVGTVGLGHMARQDFARGMHRHVGSFREHCYRIPSQGTSHRVLARGTDMGHRHGSLIRKSLPRLNITAAYKQRHPG